MSREILVVNPKPPMRKMPLPPAMDDADDIFDDKFGEYLPCRVLTALQNADVKTIGELKRWARSDRFRMTKNLGPIGRDCVRRLLDDGIDSDLSIRAERGSMQGLARDLCETTSQARVDWFRALGKRLREGGFAHAIVDELEAYTE